MNTINTDKSKISIDKDKCIVCALCSQIYPATFELDSNEIKIIGPSTKPAKEIEESCPSGAISVSGE